MLRLQCNTNVELYQRNVVEVSNSSLQKPLSVAQTTLKCNWEMIKNMIQDR